MGLTLRPWARRALLRGGIIWADTAPRTAILDFLSTLRPVATGHPLIRIGGEGDGGYLVPDDLEGIAACFSPGVGSRSDFEAMLADRHGIPSHLADHTIDRGPEGFDFVRRRIADRTGGDDLRLADWVAMAGPPPEADLLLQMDIEGDEYPVLIDTPVELLRRFRVIVIEFHGLRRIYNPATLTLLRPIFDKVTRDFAVAHLHANRNGRVFRSRGIAIPDVVEMTFLRKDRLKPGGPAPASPHPLDRSNHRFKPDIAMPQVWMR